MPTNTRKYGFTATPSGFDFDCLPPQARRYIRSLEDKISNLKNEFTIRKDQECSELEIRLQKEKAVRGWLERELERQDRIVRQQRQEILHLTSVADRTGPNFINQAAVAVKTVAFAEPSEIDEPVTVPRDTQPQPTANFNLGLFSPKTNRQHMRKYVPNVPKGSRAPALRLTMLSNAKVPTASTIPGESGPKSLHNGHGCLRSNIVPDTPGEVTDVPRLQSQTSSTAAHHIVFPDLPSFHSAQSTTTPTNIDPVIDIIKRQAYDKLLDSLPAAVSDETGFWNQLMNDLATSAAQTMLELQINDNEGGAGKTFQDETKEQIGKRKREIARFFAKLNPGSGGGGGGQGSSKHPDTVPAQRITVSRQPPFTR